MCHGTKTKKYIPANKEKQHRVNARPYVRQKYKLTDEHEEQ